MRALSSHDLLALWESGSRLHPLDQGLLALRIALPEDKRATVGDWTLGRRNRALLELHSACFGSQLHAWAACERCGEKMEFQVEIRSLLGDSEESPREIETVVVDGRTFRLPTSRDLAEAVRGNDAMRGALYLLDRCHIAGDAAGWTEEYVNVVGERFAEADPIAELRLALACPACGEEMEESLDPVTFFWSELQAMARRILLQVHTLASAYGWSEREILALSDTRRSFYLQMVNA
jgi:hypothetical protein